jgi:nucleotide-binding universal stress UspA family protein
MIKDLFFPVADIASDDATIQVAAEIASAYGAHLIAAVPVPIIGPLASPWTLPSATVVAEMVQAGDRHARERVAELRERLRQMEVMHDVRVDENRLLEPPRSLGRQARYADASIIAQPDRQDSATTHAYFNALLFESGRPVLVVPSAGRFSRRFRKMLVAWKPTREAARAVHDAIALFEPESAEVLAIDPEVGATQHGAEPGADIGTHLARHGLAVSVSTRPSGPRGVADTVLRHAAEVGADLVVAGGYGHARVMEWALGGTTRELLAELNIPVLFSH